MKSVLIGNGINIQFGGKAYSNDFIMKRIIFNANANRYDSLFAGQISGRDIEGIFKSFIDIANGIRNGDYDKVDGSDDREAIRDFKNRYDAPIGKYYEIMMEDWFLLIRLFFISNADLKDQWQSSKQGFEHMILDAIYNDGKLLDLHQNMNKNVKRFFSGFDNIFSLNYDSNLEVLTGRDVRHLHGDYSILADSENPEIVQGYMHTQAGETVVIDDFRHCFCNALLDYSGELKFRRASAIMEAIVEMDHWLNLFRHNQKEYEKQMVLLKDKDTFAWQCVSTYVQNPALKVGTDYHFETFTNLEGELHIIGLSPNNDSHIFRCINESKFEKIYFYYYSDRDKNISITKPYELTRVEDLWNSLGAQRKRYRCSYPIPCSPDIDELLNALNAISFDPVNKEKIIDEINSIPQFQADYLCKIVRNELEQQKPKSESELYRSFRAVSRIGLREGVLPSALFLLYLMNGKSL